MQKEFLFININYPSKNFGLTTLLSGPRYHLAKRRSATSYGGPSLVQKNLPRTAAEQIEHILFCLLRPKAAGLLCTGSDAGVCPAQSSADGAEQALVIYFDQALQETMAADDQEVSTERYYTVNPAAACSQTHRDCGSR